jgi:hypothetical protein
MKKLILITLITLLTSCATIIDTPYQDVTITTLNDNSKHTKCSLVNEEGAYLNVHPGQTINIHKDGNPMIIKCENHTQIATTHSSPKFQPIYLFLDVLTGSFIVTATIDGVTNSIFEYPALITVPMEDK